MKINEKLRLPLLIGLSISIAAFTIGLLLPEEFSTKTLGLLKDYLKNIHFSFFGIFLNNFKASLIIFLGGFIFAIPTFILYVLNFMILGTACSFSFHKGLGLKFLASVLPHGIFELPAIFISFCLGISITMGLFRKLWMKKEFDLVNHLRFCSLWFVKAVIPLLVAAAVIEVYITPRIIGLIK